MRRSAAGKAPQVLDHASNELIATVALQDELQRAAYVGIVDLRQNDVAKLTDKLIVAPANGTEGNQGGKRFTDN